MCVPIEQPFPSINPARTGTGPCGGWWRSSHTALSPQSGPPSSRNGDADRRGTGSRCQRRSASRRASRAPSSRPRVRVAPPEHRLRALDRRQPPVVAELATQIWTVPGGAQPRSRRRGTRNRARRRGRSSARPPRTRPSCA